MVKEEKEMNKKEEKKLIKTEDTKIGKIVSCTVFYILLILFAFAMGVMAGCYLTVKDNQETFFNETECDTENADANDGYYTDDNELYGIELISQRIQQMDSILELGKISNTEQITDEYLFDYAVQNIHTADGRYKLEDINDYLTKVFDRTLQEPKNYEGTFAICEYNKEDKIFDCLGQGGNSYVSLNRIISMKNKDDIYTIEVKKAITIVNDIGFLDAPYYKSVEDLKNEKNPLFKANMVETDNGPEYEIHPSILFNDKSNSSLPTYTYTFKKVEENFIFVSMTY